MKREGMLWLGKVKLPGFVNKSLVIKSKKDAVNSNY